MYKPIDDKEIDQKIHQFMARKSTWGALSRKVSGVFRAETDVRSDGAHMSGTDISYEPLKWGHTGESVFRSRLQKAH